METDIIQFLMFLIRRRGGPKIITKKNPACIFSSATIAKLGIVSGVCKKAGRHGDANHPGRVTDHVS